MTNFERYRILSTYDGAVILRKLGERYSNLGEIHKAATAAYKKLSKGEQARDYWEASSELEKIAKETEQ